MTIRVYLAEGDAYLRDGLRLLLASHGDIGVIGETADAWQAIGEVATLRPDVALIGDCRGGPRGFETISLLHTAVPGVRLLALSLDATTEHVFRALAAGAHGYLAKSCAAAEIVDAVHAVHRSGRYVSEKLARMLADEYLRKGRSAIAHPRGPA